MSMTATAPPRGAGRHQGLALAVICAAQLMVVLDATIVNVALPSIDRSLNFSAGNLEWVITAYSLTFGGLLLFGGRTGDLFGRRRMFMLGIAVFTLASLVGGLATSPAFLIAARAAQGIGGAIASPTALALITTNFGEGPERNRAMGIYAGMSGGGGALGLLLGGVLTDLVSWRWVMFVNVPIGLAVFALTRYALHESETKQGGLDIPGAVTVTGGMTSLVYGLSNAATHSWGDPATIVALAAAAVLLVAFVVIEWRTPDALMPLRILTDRNRSGAYAVMLAVGGAMFGMFFFLTLFIQGILGWSPLKAGVGFLPLTFVIIVVSAVGSRFIPRVGVRVPLLVGPALVAAALFLLSRLSASSGYLDILGPMLLMALGMGCIFVPLTLTAVAGVRNEEAGLASALLNTTQQIGGAIGLAALATVAASAAKTEATSLAAAHGGQLSPALRAAATTHGYTQAFLVASLIAVGALVISALSIRVSRQAVEQVDPLAATAG